MHRSGSSISATEDSDLLRSAIEPTDVELRRTNSSHKNQIWGHTTIRIPLCPDSRAIIAEERQLYGDDLGLGIGTIRAIDWGQTQSDSNPREADLTQIFIKAHERRHYCLRLWRGNNIQDLWNKIQNLLGIPEQGQNLIYMGCSVQDNYTLQNYSITTDLTIIINLRLRGGCSRTSSKNTAPRTHAPSRTL